MAEDRTETVSWLVLVHQFPQNPGSLRVKVWRRLQNIGAIAIKSSMYVLPRSDQTREDFAWLLREIRSGGAEGAILEARFLDGLDDRQIRALFNEARDADYKALSDEARAVLEGIPGKRNLEAVDLQSARQQLARLRRRLSEIEGIDFFGAAERGVAQGLVGTLTDRIADDPKEHVGETMTGAVSIDGMRGKVWVTRRGVRVDRIASAWLVRRFIDPGAVFKFSSEKSYVPGKREVRFDMFEAEFTHEADRCTFEVLIERAGLDDPALRRIGEIVHDIDLKDGRYAHQETAGIASLLDGIVLAVDDDEERIARGGELFDTLYGSFRLGKARP